MRITEVKVSKFKGGYRIRAEGEDLEKDLIDGRVKEDSVQAAHEVRRLMFQLIPQELMSYGGRAYTESEAAELDAAHRRMGAAMADPVSERPLESGDIKLPGARGPRNIGKCPDHLQPVVPDSPRGRDELPPPGVTRKR